MGDESGFLPETTPPLESLFRTLEVLESNVSEQIRSYRDGTEKGAAGDAQPQQSRQLSQQQNASRSNSTQLSTFRTSPYLSSTSNLSTNQNPKFSPTSASYATTPLPYTSAPPNMFLDVSSRNDAENDRQVTRSFYDSYNVNEPYPTTSHYNACDAPERSTSLSPPEEGGLDSTSSFAGSSSVLLQQLSSPPRTSSVIGAQSTAPPVLLSPSSYPILSSLASSASNAGAGTGVGDDSPIGMAVKMHTELRNYEKQLLKEKLELMESEKLLKVEKKKLWERIQEFQRRVKMQEEAFNRKTEEYKNVAAALKAKKAHLKKQSTWHDSYLMKKILVPFSSWIRCKASPTRRATATSRTATRWAY